MSGLASPWLVLGVFALLAFAGCLESGPQASQPGGPLVSPALLDPALPGPLRVASHPYEFGLILVEDPQTGLRYPAAVRGSVHFPTDGTGPYPLLLFMHGRHGTCQVMGSKILGPGVCPETPVSTPVDSYTGYDYLAAHLAGWGYVVASIDANHINEKDAAGDYGMLARAQLTLQTLDEFHAVNATGRPAAPLGDALAALQGRLDMSRIGLLGHSRGGEGVARAVALNLERAAEAHAIGAVFALAPTDFHRQVVTHVPFGVLLPYCDGDVRTLHGTWMYDDARYADARDGTPKHQFVVLGANHNFYNTVWTNDDASWMQQDPHCGLGSSGDDPSGGRWSAEDQRRHGLALMAAFLRTYVGGEAGFEPWLRGAAPAPASACPPGEPCHHRILVSYHPGIGDRRVVEDTLDRRALERNDLGGAVSFTGFEAVRTCDPAACGDHRTYAAAHQLRVDWLSASTYAASVPASEADVSTLAAVAFRAGIDYSDERNRDRDRQDVSVRLTDTQGRSFTVWASAHSEALQVPPGAGQVPKVTLNMVRIPLAAFEGVDPSALASLELGFDASSGGTVQLTDLMFVR